MALTVFDRSATAMPSWKAHRHSQARLDLSWKAIAPTPRNGIRSCGKAAACPVRRHLGHVTLKVCRTPLTDRAMAQACMYAHGMLCLRAAVS